MSPVTWQANNADFTKWKYCEASVDLLTSGYAPYDPSHARLHDATTYADSRIRRRITSYNVCYTKLLRIPGGAFTGGCALVRALVAQHVFDTLPVSPGRAVFGWRSQRRTSEALVSQAGACGVDRSWLVPLSVLPHSYNFV